MYGDTEYTPDRPHPHTTSVAGIIWDFYVEIYRYIPGRRTRGLGMGMFCCLTVHPVRLYTWLHMVTHGRAGGRGGIRRVFSRPGAGALQCVIRPLVRNCVTIASMSCRHCSSGNRPTVTASLYADLVDRIWVPVCKNMLFRNDAMGKRSSRKAYSRMIRVMNGIAVDRLENTELTSSLQ